MLRAILSGAILSMRVGASPQYTSSISSQPRWPLPFRETSFMDCITSRTRYDDDKYHVSICQVQSGVMAASSTWATRHARHRPPDQQVPAVGHWRRHVTSLSVLSSTRNSTSLLQFVSFRSTEPLE